MISGFPGETDQDHRELADFIQQQRFEHLGVFLIPSNQARLPKSYLIAFQRK